MNESSQTQNQDQREESTTPSRPLDIPGGGYQRGMQTSRPAAAYPGAYPGSYASKTTGYDTASADNDRKLTIGRGITLSGEIEACDHLLVEGTVEAALKGASVLDIAESGTFYGTVEIDEATVAGRFEGEITVHGRLVVKSSGVITGSLSYKELEVEAGAVLDGRITPVSGSAEGKKSQGQKKDAPTPRLKPQKDRLEAANSDGELFAEKATAAE